MGMYGQEIVHRHDGLTKVAIQQMVKDGIKCFVSNHDFLLLL